jgi:hypothetical protein
MGKVDLEVFSQSSRVVAIVDRDNGSEPARKQFISNCEKNRVEVFRLQRYAIENYFTVGALKAVFKGQIRVETIDPNIRVNDQLGMDVKNNGWKILQQMRAADLRGTDIADIVSTIVGKIAK